jgi:hypothetical protein
MHHLYLVPTATGHCVNICFGARRTFAERRISAKCDKRKHFTQVMRLSPFGSEKDRNLGGGVGTVWLSDYIACADSSLSVEFVALMRRRHKAWPTWFSSKTKG